jgi:putative endonuclease
LYTGWTNDLEKRVEAHNRGQGALYTKARLPVRLVYSESCETKQGAMQREWAIKRLTRSRKLALIQGNPAFSQGSGPDVGA